MSPSVKLSYSLLALGCQSLSPLPPLPTYPLPIPLLAPGFQFLSPLHLLHLLASTGLPVSLNTVSSFQQPLTLSTGTGLSVPLHTTSSSHQLPSSILAHGCQFLSRLPHLPDIFSLCLLALGCQYLPLFNPFFTPTSFHWCQLISCPSPRPSSLIHSPVPPVWPIHLAAISQVFFFFISVVIQPAFDAPSTIPPAHQFQNLPCFLWFFTQQTIKQNFTKL